LRENEKRFRRLFEGHDAIMLLTEPDTGAIVDANSAATQFYGYSRETLCKMTIEDINLLEADEALDREHHDKIHGQNHFVSSHRLSTGEVRTVEVHSSRIDTQGQIFIFSIVHDVTERTLAEQEKMALQTNLFQSQKIEALGTLVAGIAHDFNNILQIVLGYSQLLLDDRKKGDPDYEDLQTIIRSGKEGAELVEKLLAFRQQRQIFPFPLELNHQINHLSTVISCKLPPSVRIELNLADGPTTIRADHNQIDQVVTELAINSSEAMPYGGELKIATAIVSLNDEYCRSHQGSRPGSYVMLSVTDTGRGMGKDTLGKIFDPFFSTKQRGAIRGTGLGLSVTQGIVQQHGGHITCDSELGKGTEIRVYFPAIHTSMTTAKLPVPRVQSAKPETILVVENSNSVAEFERKVLENNGYNVMVAITGKEAIDIYQARKDEISLVILDLLPLETPERDCLMELLKIEPSISVIVASGYAPEDDLHREIRPLVKGFLHKPFAMAQLLMSVRTALDSD
jgi:PAS domain S-box-containing protein